MKKNMTIKLAVVALLLIAFVVFAIVAPAENNMKCEECGAQAETCDVCGGTGVGETPADSNYYSTFMALAPPVIAIVLALVTKEVYSSLFIGVLSGALLDYIQANGNMLFGIPVYAQQVQSVLSLVGVLVLYYLTTGVLSKLPRTQKP